ncbi:unnamed protein product [Moneuplotes crassus]|uniref:Uncharacterized protein n=2 Tax=Euplotes crassus TaxID=5936 RepID=A0AAD1UE65_EUPCR|nr:unnamed protein product [Moneuplotes crassus]
MYNFSKKFFSISYKHVRLSFGDNARAKVAEGMRIMANVTSKTYGPGGRNVALEYDLGDPKITKDGVTVAKNVFFKDREKELGAKLLKRIADSTNKYCGDGTTLSAIFGTSLVSKSCNAITHGIHPTMLKRGIEKGRDSALEILKQFVMPVTNEEELKNICLVSSNYNEEIADITSRAINSIDSTVGMFGNLEIEPSKVGKNQLEINKGLYIDRGFVSNEFCNTSYGDEIMQEVTLDYPMILIVHDPIKKNEHIVKVMDLAKKNKRSLLVISTDLREGPLSSMVYNAQKDVINCCAINVPYMVGKEQDYLEDLAVITGATILKNDNMVDGIEQVKLEHFGSAAKVIISELKTQFIKGAGTDKEIDKHMEVIKARIEQEPSKHFKKIMRDRFTKLNQLQATIYVGGTTDVEQGEIRDLIVDSLNSARAALEHGILPGGGAAMYHASKLLPVYTNIEMFEESVGLKIFQDSMQLAIRKVIENSVGEDLVGHYLQEINKKENYLYGYNCKTEKVENLYEAGILDSYKVISSVIEDASRLATMVIMVECNVVKMKNYTPMPVSEHQNYREFF